MTAMTLPAPPSGSTSAPPGAASAGPVGLVAAVDEVPWATLWLRTSLTGLLILGVVFGAYEVVERLFLTDAPHSLLYTLHIVRGSSSAVLLGTWAFMSIRRARERCDATLRENVRQLERLVEARTREAVEARAFTELLFDTLSERVVVRDAGGVVVKENRAARASDEQVEARGERADLRIEDDERGRVWEVERVPVPSVEGRAGLVLEVGRDVTHQRSLEAQLRHQEKMAALGLMAAGFAHDLGNPLASIMSELELLEGETDVEAYRASLAVLRDQVARISSSLREMVDFARRRRDQVTDVHVSRATQDSLRLLRHDQRLRCIEVEVDVAPDVPDVRMVEDHLVHVLVNVLVNAADAMPKGGKLTIRARRHERRVHIEVEDTGMGMTPEVLAEAHKPLFSTKGARGTGLGLPVSIDVVKSVGGRLWLESEPNQGTRVHIELPAAGEEERDG